MSIEPIRQLNVYYEPRSGVRTRVGRLARPGHEILFEYDADFLARGPELSPFRLRKATGVFTGRPERFEGLFGLFDDSLPDGWGRLLLDRRAIKAGASPRSLGPLDRLAYIGARGMGALTYEPEIPQEQPTVVDLVEVAAQTKVEVERLSRAELERLFMIGGSPAGARPKAMVQISERSPTLLFGGQSSEPGYVPYLVKFPAPLDPKWIAPMELAYMRMAQAAGIEVPEALLLCRTSREPGFFAVKRFDRAEHRRIHLHTICGLLEAPHIYPSIGYDQLLVATRSLTRDESAVAEIFRRACFNVFAHNRDDHSKNFAFLMDESGQWRPSPAYDLTYSEGPGGQHAMILAGESGDPGEAELLRLAEKVGLRGAREIIDRVRGAVVRFLEFAEEMPAGARRALAQRLGASAPPKRTRRGRG